MKPTEYSILPQSNTRARVPIASWLWLGILHCLALVIWHQSTEPKALSNSLSGPAWIRDIEPCQGVLPGDGQVITATFLHSSGDVIDLVWSDDESRNLESIGTTSNHPFYSFDRADYVQAGSLQEGERLLTYSGDTKRVVSKLARPGPEPVYNLEVFGEHVYFIGHDGVLVHNSDSYNLNAGTPVSGLRTSRGAGVGPIVDSAKVEKILGNLESRGVTIVRGDRAASVLDDIGAGAAYHPMFGKPHLFFNGSVTRGQLVEELLHHGQSLRRGHAQVLDSVASKRRVITDEIHAQSYMINHAVRKGWTKAEIEFYQNQQRLWLIDLVKFNKSVQ